MNPNPKVDAFFARPNKWMAEMELLRSIILECKLTEELKWGNPCYTLEDKNVVLIHGFKEYCALLFMKGVLMEDPKGILIQQTANVQSARQIRFTNLQEIQQLKTALKAYVKQAIEIEKSGKKVEMIKSTELVYPEELQHQFKKNPAFKKAFLALTPGRQRAYNLFFTQPKQSSTRISRIEKSIPKILEGKGLND